MREARKDVNSATDFSSKNFLRSIQRLEPEALDALHDAFFPKLYRYALYSLGERLAGQEIASEVFLKLVGRLRQGIKMRNLPGWLFAAAAEQVQARILAALPGPPSEMSAELGKYGPLFRRSLHTLAPEQQHFLALRFSQEAALEEIAGWLGSQERELHSLQLQSLNMLLGALGGKPIIPSEEPMERALQVCLQNLGSGSRLDEISASYPKWSQELHALLEAAHFSQYPGGIDPRQKTQPLAGMEDLQEAQDRSKAEFLQAAQVRIARPQPGRTGKWLVISMVVVLLLAMCGAGMAALSANSVPGNALYGVQRGFEELRLALTRYPSARLEVELFYDQRRLDEVEELLEKGWTGAVVFGGVLEQNQGDRWQVGGVPVSVSPETEILGSIQPGYSVTVQGEITPERTVQAERLQMREIQMQGKIQSLSEANLVIDGVQVILTPETIWQGQAEAGSRVIVYLLLPENMPPQARLVEVLE
ncbi:MAG: hypothetical protein A2Z16_06005 [Chloroflexi bacterium RBG_16_54_18]|nr:MAG: hypothetical protein A2Z16_06005 [Chloroflexi bacterium RBG_16_54_18]